MVVAARHRAPAWTHGNLGANAVAAFARASYRQTQQVLATGARPVPWPDELVPSAYRRPVPRAHRARAAAAAPRRRPVGRRSREAPGGAPRCRSRGARRRAGRRRALDIRPRAGGRRFVHHDGSNRRRLLPALASHASIGGLHDSGPAGRTGTLARARTHGDGSGRHPMGRRVRGRGNLLRRWTRPSAGVRSAGRAGVGGGRRHVGRVAGLDRPTRVRVRAGRRRSSPRRHRPVARALADGTGPCAEARHRCRAHAAKGCRRHPVRCRGVRARPRRCRRARHRTRRRRGRAAGCCPHAAAWRSRAVRRPPRLPAGGVPGRRHLPPRQSRGQPAGGGHRSDAGRFQVERVAVSSDPSAHRKQWHSVPGGTRWRPEPPREGSNAGCRCSAHSQSLDWNPR